MIKKLALTVCILILCPVGISYGQNFDSMYGSGIHKFFSGCNAEAIQLFDAAIATNPNDPRPYYFRGLAKMNYGDQYAAQADFQMGAQMEAMGKRRSSTVSRSLERIQGSNRLCIEQARQNAFNSNIQTARYGYSASPNNVVYGQPLTHPVVPPNASAPLANPSQTIIPTQTETAAMPDKVLPVQSGAAAEPTVSDPTNLLTTPESTTTSFPGTPDTSNAVTPADATPAVESGLDTPNAVDGPTTEARTQSPTAKSSNNSEPLQAAEPDSAQSDSPFGTEPTEQNSTPESKPAPTIDEPIEFPSEPTDESPFGDAPAEESDLGDDAPANDAPAEDIPMEDESAKQQDSSDELTEESADGEMTDNEESTDEESDIIDDPFGG